MQTALTPFWEEKTRCWTLSERMERLFRQGAAEEGTGGEDAFVRGFVRGLRTTLIPPRAP